jgi:hypothetical protein
MRCVPSGAYRGRRRSAGRRNRSRGRRSEQSRYRRLALASTRGAWPRDARTTMYLFRKRMRHFASELVAVTALLGILGIIPQFTARRATARQVQVDGGPRATWRSQRAASGRRVTSRPLPTGPTFSIAWFHASGTPRGLSWVDGVEPSSLPTTTSSVDTGSFIVLASGTLGIGHCIHAGVNSARPHAPGSSDPG